MSELEAARKCRDMLLRREAAAKSDEERKELTIKIKEMQKHISLIHRKNKGL